jgi:hypothetical protein
MKERSESEKRVLKAFDDFVVVASEVLGNFDDRCKISVERGNCAGCTFNRRDCCVLEQEMLGI